MTGRYAGRDCEQVHDRGQCMQGTHWFENARTDEQMDFFPDESARTYGFEFRSSPARCPVCGGMMVMSDIDLHMTWHNELLDVAADAHRASAWMTPLA